MTQATEAINYPRQEALTQNFRLGLPRGFHVDRAGTRLAFIRSRDGRTTSGDLWLAEARDGGLVERRVVDAAELLAGASEDVPPEEAARRERMRVTTTGITSISTDRDLSVAAFCLDGIPYRVALPQGGVEALPHPGPCIDPRVSPDGRWVAYVSARSVFVVPSDGSAAPMCLASPDGDDETWGLADFIAGEELGRARGLWWLPDSRTLLAEWADESPVDTWWISDPAAPGREPRPHRYPSAGTANAEVRLFRLDLDGGRTEVDWDHDAYPYLATVEVGDAEVAGDAAIVSVLSRDQQLQQILRVGPREAAPMGSRQGAPWLTLFPGVPCLGPSGQLVEIVADAATDTFRLTFDGDPATPAGLQVTGVAHVSPSGIVLTGQDDPREHHVHRLDRDGTLERLTTGATVNAVAAGTGGHVIVTVSSTSTSSRYSAALLSGRGDIASFAETPVVHPDVHLHRVGERELSVALLLPTGHVPGSRRLPVVMCPYGGPHSARVVHSARAFADDQWLADQGFAVLVADGRGTPGRGPAWEHAVAGDLADVVLQDQVDALVATAELHPDLDLTRVAIGGWSFGGYLAALAVLDRPDVFGAAFAGAPVTDWRLYDTAYTERYLGLPDDGSGAYERTSLITRAHRLQRPLMLVHGLADDNVAAAHTLQLSHALLAAGRPHGVLPLVGVTHMTPQVDVAENLRVLELEFYREHLQRPTAG